MIELNICSKTGYTLHGFIQGAEDELLGKYQPVTASVITITVGDAVLFGYNLNRQQWELPGGRIEEGESPLACAHRELAEESTQQISDLQFSGLAYMQRPNGDYKYTALYTGHLTELQPFEENDEWNQIKLRDNDEDDGADLIHVEFVALNKE